MYVLPHEITLRTDTDWATTLWDGEHQEQRIERSLNGGLTWQTIAVVPSAVSSDGEAITREQAIAIASLQVQSGAQLQSVDHGPFAQMYVDHVRTLPPGSPQQSQREVWAVTFNVVFDDICPPNGSPCLPPRPGTLTVFIDYVTGDLVGSAGFGPNPAVSTDEPSPSPSQSPAGSPASQPEPRVDGHF